MFCSFVFHIYQFPLEIRSTCLNVLMFWATCEQKDVHCSEDYNMMSVSQLLQYSIKLFHLAVLY